MMRRLSRRPRRSPGMPASMDPTIVPQSALETVSPNAAATDETFPSAHGLCRRSRRCRTRREAAERRDHGALQEIRVEFHGTFQGFGTISRHPLCKFCAAFPGCIEYDGAGDAGSSPYRRISPHLPQTRFAHSLGFHPSASLICAGFTPAGRPDLPRPFFRKPARVIIAHVGRCVTLLSSKRIRCFVGRTLLGVLMLMASHRCQAAGQTTASRGPASDRIQNHFAAAQQAQQSNDYATAEREYQAVLIEAPTLLRLI